MNYHNFKPIEFACQCGCGLMNIDPRQLAIAEIVRTFEGGKPYSPNSGCRCREHNETVQRKYVKNYKPYTSRSWHMPKDDHGELAYDGICHAVDYPSKKPKKLYKHLNKLFPDIYGMIRYSWGVHVDLRPVKYRG